MALGVPLVEQNEDRRLGMDATALQDGVDLPIKIAVKDAHPPPPRIAIVLCLQGFELRQGLQI